MNSLSALLSAAAWRLALAGSPSALAAPVAIGIHGQGLTLLVVTGSRAAVE